MVKGSYQLPLHNLVELLHSNIWWSDGLEFVNNGFSYVRGLELYRKGIRCVEDNWDKEYMSFHSWDDAQIKFDLTEADNED